MGPFQGAVKPVLGSAEVSTVLAEPCERFRVLSLEAQQVAPAGTIQAVAELLNYLNLLAHDRDDALRAEQVVGVGEHLAEIAQVVDRVHVISRRDT